MYACLKQRMVNPSGWHYVPRILSLFFSYYYFFSGDTDDFNHTVKKKYCVHADNIIHDHFNVTFNQESPTRLCNKLANIRINHIYEQQ